MLPTTLIHFLRTYVDDATQMRFDYAYQRLDPTQVDVRMFWTVIESDTILDIATSPYVDLQHWFVLFSKDIRQPNFHDPVVLTPNSPPTADSPMTNLEQRLLAFHRSMSNTPQRHIPALRPRANRDVHDIVTEQYNIALHSPYGTAFHTRDATYMRRQEFLFRSNMAEQLARFGRTPQTDYSSILPPTLVSRSLVLGSNASITGSPTRSSSLFTQDLIHAHETQKQIQLQHIHDTGVTSNAATTILAMNTHAVLDAAESIYGSSSAPTRGLGILRHPPASEQPPSFHTATLPRPRPKPLNFGLDQRERDVLLAVTQATNTPAVPVDSDYDDCSIPSIPSEDLPTIYAAQQRDHVSQITGDTTTPHSATTRVLRTPLEFYTAMDSLIPFQKIHTKKKSVMIRLRLHPSQPHSLAPFLSMVSYSSIT